jgi:hypothetical protein
MKDRTIDNAQNLYGYIELSLVIVQCRALTLAVFSLLVLLSGTRDFA